MSLLDVKNLRIDFRLNEKTFPAVNTLSFSMNQGETLSFIGESGCGKSLTALAVLKLLPPSAQLSKNSVIRFKDREIQDLSHPQMREIRGKGIGMVFQEPMTSLNPVYSIGFQVDEIFKAHTKIGTKEAKERTLEALKRVHLPDPEKVYQSYPHELSGGMRQRVMIGMATALNPDLLLADEPTTALDVTIQAQIMELLEELKSKGQAVLLISHNLMLVKSFAHRIAILYAGEIVEEAPAALLFENPLHPYTLGLLKAIPMPGLRERLNEIPGFVPSLEKIPQNRCRFYDRCPQRMKICFENPPQLKGESHQVRCFLHEKH